MSAPKKVYQPDAIKEAKAALALRQSMADLDGDDALLLDTIEGETSLWETLDALLARMANDAALIVGIDAVISDLETRRDRFKHRREQDRAMIEQALRIADVDVAVERPLGTLSLTRRPPSVVIETEADIPAEFWKAGKPSLDTKALSAALKARLEAIESLPDDPAARMAALASLPPQIPGATLSNGSQSLTIRVK